MPRFYTVFLVSLVALALAGCGQDEAEHSPNNTAPDIGEATDVGQSGPVDLEKLFANGPYEVGYVEFDLSYMPPGATEARVLPVKAWYPAADDSGAEPVVYRVADIVQVTSPLALDAPDAAPGPFPVLIYSHGFGGEGLLGYPYGENFASWGWVVVSPNHVGSTALDGVQMTLAPFAENVLYRVTDISALIDGLEQEATGTALDGLSDTDEIALFGHSFGGYTTLAAGGADYDYDRLSDPCPLADDDGSCDFLADPEVEAAFRAGFGDARIDAIVSQAPALVPGFSDGALAGIEIPTMIQSGARDATTPDATQAEPAWNALDGASDVWVRMPDGGHYTFISICYDLSEQILNLFRPDAASDGCGADFIDPQIALPILNAYLRAFAETHVLGSTEWTAVLDGTEPLGEGFDVTTK